MPVTTIPDDIKKQYNRIFRTCAREREYVANDPVTRRTSSRITWQISKQGKFICRLRISWRVNNVVRVNKSENDHETQYGWTTQKDIGIKKSSDGAVSDCELHRHVQAALQLI